MSQELSTPLLPRHEGPAFCDFEIHGCHRDRKRHLPPLQSSFAASPPLTSFHYSSPSYAAPIIADLSGRKRRRIATASSSSAASTSPSSSPDSVVAPLILPPLQYPPIAHFPGSRLSLANEESRRDPRPIAIQIPQRRASSSLDFSRIGGSIGEPVRSKSATYTDHQDVPPPAREAPPPQLNSSILMNPDLEPRTYNLIIRQSPKHGQMCTLGSKDRRILDPLPIIELDMRDQYGNRDFTGQTTPFLIMQVNLVADEIEKGYKGSSSGEGSPVQSNTKTASERASQESEVVEPRGLPVPSSSILPAPHDTAFPALRLLEGKLTASAHIVRDIEKEGLSQRHSSVSTEVNENKACFFIFTDLSIRMRGTYRLQFSLVRLGSPTTSHRLDSSSSGSIVAQVTSESFPIYHARDFAGMSESTPLAKSLANQGVHVPIRNESRWRSGKTPSSERKA